MLRVISMKYLIISLKPTHKNTECNLQFYASNSDGLQQIVQHNKIQQIVYFTQLLYNNLIILININVDLIKYK